MNAGKKCLMRNIRAEHEKDGRVMSLAFKPMPKDQSCLSVDHEALVSA